MCLPLVTEPLSWHLFNLANTHEVLHVGIGDGSARVLQPLAELLHHADQEGLDLSGEELALTVPHSDVLKPIVVLQEESQVLEGYINVKVAAIGPMLLYGLPTSRLGILVDLAFDVSLSVRHQDGAVRIR